MDASRWNVDHVTLTLTHPVTGEQTTHEAVRVEEADGYPVDLSEVALARGVAVKHARRSFGKVPMRTRVIYTEGRTAISHVFAYED